MNATLLGTSTAVYGGDDLLSRLVAERLGERSIAVRSIDLRDVPEPAQDALEGVETLVLLGRAGGEDVDGTGGSAVDLAGVRRLLAAASAAGIRSLVVLSGAMVYGARDDNPVPLTEAAQLRPEPGLAYALELTELERITLEYRNGRERTVAVLRPAIVLGPTSVEWLRRSAWGRRQVPLDDDMAARQFLHIDDLVNAIQVAVELSLDGAFNVAPDGWIAGDTFRQLVGGTLGAVPARLRRPISWMRRALFAGRVPAGLVAYTRAPWVVANDRLRAVGWTPTYTSEEVFVEADRARGWRALSPRTRQELSLGAVAGVVIALVVGSFVWLRRKRPPS